MTGRSRMASMKSAAANVRRIGAPNRGGMRPANKQSGCGCPSGFGLRQSSAAFPPTAQPPTKDWSPRLDEHGFRKRQRTAVVQNVIARFGPPDLSGPSGGGLKFQALNLKPPHVGCYIGSWKASRPSTGNLN
jgi:hypothetical protein